MLNDIQSVSIEDEHKERTRMDLWNIIYNIDRPYSEEEIEHYNQIRMSSTTRRLNIDMNNQYEGGMIDQEIGMIQHRMIHDCRNLQEGYYLDYSLFKNLHLQKHELEQMKMRHRQDRSEGYNLYSTTHVYKPSAEIENNKTSSILVFDNPETQICISGRRVIRNIKKVGIGKIMQYIVFRSTNSLNITGKINLERLNTATLDTEIEDEFYNAIVNHEIGDLLIPISRIKIQLRQDQDKNIISTIQSEIRKNEGLKLILFLAELPALEFLFKQTQIDNRFVRITLGEYLMHSYNRLYWRSCVQIFSNYVLSCLQHLHSSIDSNAYIPNQPEDYEGTKIGFYRKNAVNLIDVARTLCESVDALYSHLISNEPNVREIVAFFLYLMRIIECDQTEHTAPARILIKIWKAKQKSMNIE